jgi:tRNA/rRNA methyltransferase
MRVVLVSPEYAFNAGSICRVMANFGFSDLRIVDPKCDLSSVDAYRGAKHAKSVLEGAKIHATLEDACRGGGPVFGTTGILVRNKGTIRGTMPLSAFAAKYGKRKKITLVFGREGIGLSEREIDFCGGMVHVECSPAYPVMNVTHAAAVVMHSMYVAQERPSGGGEPPAADAEMRALFRVFGEISEKTRAKRSDVAFRRVCLRAKLNAFEARALLCALRKAASE